MAMCKWFRTLRILWDSFMVMHPWFHTVQNSLFFAAPPPLMQAVMPMPPPHVSNIIHIK